MADNNVGQVELDLLLNSRSFKTQLEGAVNQAVSKTSTSISGKVGSTFGKLGKLAVAAFSVKSIAGFAKSAIDLGSDLAEVQNVVDSTFTTMSSKVDEFAANAMKDFGLSETVAKKYMGTMGAMSQSFGFTEAEALQMSKTLTGLTGDVASFYNMSSDEAFTKLKSVFTGETESLKELGVVMTQAALDEYALANSYGKTTKNMTEQEKVALRYAFVQDKLKTASGDFIRTQKGWANQTRILSLQWQSFKANLGQGFINVLTPLIQMLNLLMSKLILVSQAFKKFTEKLFGKQSDEPAKQTGQLATEAQNAAGGFTEAGKAAKKMKRSLLDIDQLHVLPDNSEQDSGAGAGGGMSGPPIDVGGTEDANSALEETNKELSKTALYLQKLKDIMSTNFWEGLGGKNLDNIKNGLKGISNGIKEIVTDHKVLESSLSFVENYVAGLSKAAGAIASIGITVGELFIGSIEKFINSRKEDIKASIISIFDIGGEISQMMGEAYKAVAQIFDVFSNEDAQGIVASTLSIFYDLGDGIVQACMRVGRDFGNILTKPIIDNVEIIKQNLGTLLSFWNEVFGSISSYVSETVEHWMSVYDEHIKPFFDSIAKGLSEIVGHFMQCWNKYFAPVLKELGKKISVLYDKHIKPVAKKVGDVIGKLADLFKVLWEKAIVPLTKYVGGNFYSTFSKVFKVIGDVAIKAITMIMDILSGLLTSLGGLIDFLTGVFSGDWQRAWQGIKDFFKGIIDSVLGIFGTNLDQMREKVSGVWDWMTSPFRTAFDWISDKIDWLKTKFKTKFEEIKETVGNIFGGICDVLKWPFNKVIDLINRMISKLNGISISFPSWVPILGGKKLGFNIPRIPRLAEGGYVGRNQPRLAMIGDNRREGEIVAPESKLTEAVSNGNRPVLNAINALLTLLTNQQNKSGENIVIPIYLDGGMLDQVIIDAQARREIRNGGY